LEARAPTQVALYLLNEKRSALSAIEANRDVRLRLAASDTLLPPDYEIVSLGARPPQEAPAALAEAREPAPAVEAMELEEEVEEQPEAVEAGAEAAERPRRRRRGRRGGRRRSEPAEAAETALAAEAEGERGEEIAEAALERDGSGRRRRRRRPRRRPLEAAPPATDLTPSELAEALNAAEAGEDEDLVEGAAPAVEPVIIASASKQPIIEAIERASDDAAEAAERALAAAPQPIVAEAEETMTAEEAPPRETPEEIAYEPDQERREKFFSRFSRWGKKP
jgi:ribonuclease E